MATQAAVRSRAEAPRFPAPARLAIEGFWSTRRVVIAALAVGSAVLAPAVLDWITGRGHAPMDDPGVAVLCGLSAACWGAVAGGLALRARVPHVAVFMTAALGGILNVGTTGLVAGLATGSGVEVIGMALFALFALSWLGALLGVGFGMLFCPLVALARGAEERPTLDALPHVTLGAAAWVTAVAAAVAVLSPARPVLGLAAVATALAMPATLWVMHRDRGWLSWLRRVHRGEAGRWTIVGREQVDGTLWLLPLFRPLRGASPTRVLAHQEPPVGEGPFRGTEELAAIALVHDPSDAPRPWASVRLPLAFVLLVLQAALLGFCAG